MSHFVCIAIVPSRIKKREWYLSRQLSPFDEGKRVKRYRKGCDCAEDQAGKKAVEVVERYGKFEAFREVVFAKLKEQFGEGAQYPFSDEQSAAIDQLWKPWNDFEEERKSFHLPAMKPDNDCYSCKGKGWYWTCYNPNSKWDWYTIGGRWTGHLSKDYEPHKDPRNIETCKICGGTGTRTDMPVYAPGADIFTAAPIRHEVAKCNACEGGKSVKYPGSWEPFEGDQLPVSQWLALLRENPKRFSGYAVLTPEREWLQQGTMRMFGVSTDEKPLENWYEQQMRVAEKYENGHVAIVVDLHI